MNPPEASWSVLSGYLSHQSAFSQAKPTFPPRKSCLNPSFQVSYFYRLKNPFFYFEMSIFGSFQEFQGPALPILPQLYVVYLLTAPGGKLHLRLVPRHSTGATELYRPFHWCLRCDWWLVLLWRWWHGRIDRVGLHVNHNIAHWWRLCGYVQVVMDAVV